MLGEEDDTDASRRDAFAAFYRRHLPAVRGQVRLWAPHDEVDEIVSSTFVTAWTKFEQIVPGSEKPWLLGVARNHCRNRLRARRRTDALTAAVARVTIADTVDPADERPDPSELVPLMQALRNLTPDEQDLLALSVWQDLAPAEIALVLGVRQGTVRVRLHRARRRLEAEYDRIVSREEVR